ncbi:MAG: type III pantothenate kinase [Phycisphaerae bacterium]|nr:type III pantothenate kinase [Phycisphaerae bacterium]
MNIIAIDIGNTRVSLAACLGKKVLGVERLATADAATLVGPAVERVRALLRPSPAPRVVVCSVNPPAADAVVAAVGKVVDWPVLFVGREIELPMPVDVESPATIGADRVVAAAAAFEAVGGPVAVASLGTALTISGVSQEGHFLGGVICPGLRISAHTLHESTAALPEVPLAKPASPFARNTVDAIQAGLFYQAGGTLREVVERMATEFGTWPHLVLTGGDAELIASAYEFVDSVVPNLTFMGINLALRKHVDAMDGRR